jgi:hypothetical protein
VGVVDERGSDARTRRVLHPFFPGAGECAQASRPTADRQERARRETRGVYRLPLTVLDQKLTGTYGALWNEYGQLLKTFLEEPLQQVRLEISCNDPLAREELMDVVVIMFQSIDATSGDAATQENPPPEYSASGCVDDAANTSADVPELTTALEVEVRSEVRSEAAVGLATVASSPQASSRCTIM